MIRRRKKIPLDDLELYAYKYDCRIKMQRTYENFIIDNPNGDHTRILLELFLETANKYLFIYCKRLSTEIYDHPSVISILKRVYKNIIIRVVTEENILHERREFLKYIPSRNIKCCPVNHANHHFWVMDDISYRKEIDSQDRKGEIHTYDKNGALIEKRIFSEMFGGDLAPCKYCKVGAGIL